VQRPEVKGSKNGACSRPRQVPIDRPVDRPIDHCAQHAQTWPVDRPVDRDKGAVDRPVDQLKGAALGWCQSTGPVDRGKGRSTDRHVLSPF